MKDLQSPSSRIWLTVFLTAIVLLVNFPVIFMALNSFQTTEQMLTSRSVFPEHYSFDNYIFLISKTPYLIYLKNSIITSLGAAFLSVFVGLLAGYALSRFSNIFLGIYSNLLFAIQMFPIILALIPLFILFRPLGLINSPLSVILVYSLINLPFITWMSRSYFDTIPRELEEAALIDGCSPIRAFVQVILPLAGPGVAAVSIFAFLFSYNEFFIANVFLRAQSSMTLPVGIQLFIQQFSTDWGSLVTAATLAMVPTLVLFLFVQKFMAHGALAGSVKGQCPVSGIGRSGSAIVSDSRKFKASTYDDEGRPYRVRNISDIYLSNATLFRDIEIVAVSSRNIDSAKRLPRKLLKGPKQC